MAGTNVIIANDSSNTINSVFLNTLVTGETGEGNVLRPEEGRSVSNNMQPPEFGDSDDLSNLPQMHDRGTMQNADKQPRETPGFSGEMIPPENMGSNCCRRIERDIRAKRTRKLRKMHSAQFSKSMMAATLSSS